MKRRSLFVTLLASVLVLVAVPASATYRGSAPTLVTKRTSGTTFQLRSLNPATGKAKLLIADGGGSIFAGQYSPNGKKIAYFGNPGGGDFEIWVAKADGSEAEQFTDNANDDQYPTWSPDGKTIAWSQDGDIVAQDINGSNFHSVHSGGTSPMILLNWSPNGKKILYNAYDGADFEIFSVRPDGSAPTQLTNNTVSDYLGDWSPDGKHIAFAESYGSGAMAIFTMSASGGNQDPLVVDATTDLNTPVYSSDGRYVIYDRNAGPYQVWRADATNGKHKEKLLAGSTDFYTFILP